MPGGSSSAAIMAQSASDPKFYIPTQDFSRALRTSDSDYEYHLSALGRLQYRDDFNQTAIQWAAASGTIAFDTTTCLKGTQSMKMTAAAAAGDQAIARKFTTICADQGFQPTPLVVLEAWFKPFDVNIRDFQMYVRLDDSVYKYEAAFRYYYQLSGSTQYGLQYLNNAGSFITYTTYPIPAPAGSVADPWHHAVMALNYKQGAGGYLNYAAIQFDDYSYIPGASSDGGHPGTPAHTITTSSIRESNIDLITTCDNSSGSVTNVDEVRFSDLSGLQNIQVSPYSP
jgi:hypothetical protein